MVKLPKLQLFKIKIKKPKFKKLKIKRPAQKSLHGVPYFLYKHLILALVLIALLSLVWGSLSMRGYLISKIEPPSVPGSDFLANDSPLPSTSNASTSAEVLDTPEPSDAAVLGASTTVPTTSYRPPALPPSPTVVPAPIYTPTPAPVSLSGSSNSSSPSPPVPSSSSSSSCNPGVPTEYNSEVYSPGPATLGATSYITVKLEDCNGNVPAVTDTIDINLKSGDSTLLVNGSTLPISQQTANGVLTFAVKAKVAGYYTFSITDTSRNPNLNLTGPGFSTPNTTFNSPQSNPTPTPTPSPTAVPNPTSSPTPPAQPSQSPSPSSSPTPTPSPSSSTH